MFSKPEQKYQILQRELRLGIFALISLIIMGTLWYMICEDWDWTDALYMTVITLSTVGFGETNPLDNNGRLFTISLIAMGLVVIGYIVNRFTEAFIQGYFQEGAKRRQQRRMIDSLMGHYILCGFGRTGRQIALEFEAEGIAFVILDLSENSVEEAKELGYQAILGDATLDATLQEVGITKADCIVAALPTDAENLYIVLSAKSLNPEVRAIARANTGDAIKKLQRGGADAVISPYITGGKRMAAAALRPQVMDFVDGILTGTDRSFYMEELLVDQDTCPYIGATLRDAKLRAQSGALIVAIRRVDGELIPGPMADTMICSGDVFICMGTAEQLRTLNKILSPLKSQLSRLPKAKQLPSADNLRHNTK